MINSIINFIQNNQFFTGFLGAATITYIGYVFRWIPNTIFKIFKRLLSSSITINSQDNEELYFIVNDWLYNCKGMKSVNLHKIDTKQNISVKFTMGYGFFFFLEQNNLIHIHKQKFDLVYNTYDQLTITIIGLNHKKIFNNIINFVKTNFGSNDDINTCFWDDYWRISRKSKRSLNTLYLNDDIKNSLINDITNFKNSETNYQKLGIPYKRGYLFIGPPGTGKTTASHCIASHFNLDIKIINLGSIDDDKDLIRAITTCSKNSIILLEDIDCVGQFAIRNNSECESNGITLSGFLNAVDGIRTPDGIIFIMTTNHPENIDPAVIRPGRIDKTIKFDNISKIEAINMAKNMNCNNLDFLNNLNYPISPATVQESILNNINK